jgi:hypothetical protein
MWCKRFWLISAVSLLVHLETEASTIRNSFVENINSGLKMLGKNDRQLFISHHSYYNQLTSGISNKVADLVSQSFSAMKNGKNRNNIRQDAIVIGDDGPSLPENPLMSGMFKMLGLDGAKIGAAAVNGIIFVAQMVRYGASAFMEYMMTRTWDWYKIVDHLSDKVTNETLYEATTATPQRIIF